MTGPDRTGFEELRSKLHALGYHNVVGIESAPVVADLLDGLVSATASVARLQAAVDTANREGRKAQVQLEPLAKENSRLLHDNNELHAALVKQGNQFRRREDEWIAKNAALTASIQDASFLNEEQAATIARLEAQLDALRTRAADSTSAAPPLSPGLHLSSPAPPRRAAPAANPSASPAAASPSRGSPVQLDLLDAANAKIEALTRDLADARELAASLTRERDALQYEVFEYEKEVARLGMIVERGTAPDRRAFDAQQAQHERELSQARLEVEVLNSELAKARDALAAANTRIDAMGGDQGPAVVAFWASALGIGLE